MNYSVGNKVFETEKEAKEFAKDLNAMGALCVAHETNQPVTHIYVMGSNGLTYKINEEDCV